VHAVDVGSHVLFRDEQTMPTRTYLFRFIEKLKIGAG